MHGTHCRTRSWPWLLGLLFVTRLTSLSNSAYAQEAALIPDAALSIPELHFDSTGELIIQASSMSSEHDFDFLVGSWTLRNRKLKSRLSNSNEWVAFESRVEMQQILSGLGNIDRYTDMASGEPYEDVVLRLFDTRTKLWSICWADGNSGKLHPPAVGSFENEVGHFFGRDTFEGQNIIVVFRWDVRNPQLPIWSQAFSKDHGRSWEWNSINVSQRAPW